MALAGPAAAAVPPEVAPPVFQPGPRAEQLTVTAPDGHRYRLLVSWPEGKPPTRGWPVLYLLDGATNFPLARDSAARRAAAGAPDGVIVAIDSGGLPRRILDYTPPAPGYVIPTGRPASGRATGGSAAFLDLIDRQVKPLIEARWRIDRRRQTLAGHSFGALLTLHALYTRPRIASRFVAISPSLWFGGTLLDDEQRAARVAGKQILLAEAPGADGTEPAAAALSARLSAAGASARFVPLPGQTHGTTMRTAMDDLVASAFAARAR